MSETVNLLVVIHSHGVEHSYQHHAMTGMVRNADTQKAEIDLKTSALRLNEAITMMKTEKREMLLDDEYSAYGRV